MNNIRAICFDLDDTLWDLQPVIPRAERMLYEWFEREYPEVTRRYTPAQIRGLRQAATERWPEIRHDLTELRLRVLRQIAAESDYDEAMVQGAYDVFFAARNDVSLYADVIPVLQALAPRYQLFALSNGNADLEAIGIAGYFAGVFGAREFGVSKPDTRFFVEAAGRCGMAVDQMVHVGDHPQNDIVAAKQTGMRAIWINRKNLRWPASECLPDHEISGLDELVTLFL
jgi:putative hydrolase of the HAD superfamily